MKASDKRMSKRRRQDDDRSASVESELQRRGMTEAEIDTALRKKRRRKLVEFDVLKSGHVLKDEFEISRRKPKAKRTKEAASATVDAAGVQAATSHAGDELCTVHFAAEQLKLHRKTVLRFIREGRLPATRVGKAYRIKRSDLETFSGLPAEAAKEERPTVTSIVDMPGVGAKLARKWASTIASTLNARPKEGATMRAETIYDSERSHLKIIVVGAPSDTVHLLSLIRVWMEQLRA